VKIILTFVTALLIAGAITYFVLAPPTTGSRSQPVVVTTSQATVARLRNAYARTKPQSGTSAALASTAQRSTTAEQATWKRLRQLRDEGIDNIGWIAGNTRGQAIWPQVEPYVGRDGEYYNAFIRLTTHEADPQTVASMNVGRYRDAVERGQAMPFSESEALSRTRRTVQIVAEMGELMAGLPSGRKP
jgi:hypothetical protein